MSYEDSAEKSSGSRSRTEEAGGQRRDWDQDRGSSNRANTGTSAGSSRWREDAADNKGGDRWREDNRGGERWREDRSERGGERWREEADWRSGGGERGEGGPWREPSQESRAESQGRAGAGWKEEAKAVAGPSYSTYTPIWSAIPTTVTRWVFDSLFFIFR